MTPRHFNVLFLCPGNSARSIMAEAIMNRKGFPNFTGFSAGSHPLGHVSPHALKQIQSGGMPVEKLRSKSWNEFEKPGAPEIHFVFNVCDSAVDEPCPVWRGQPLTARWSVPDPAAVRGTDGQIQRAYFEAYRILDRRIALFVSLPLETLERESSERWIELAGVRDNSLLYRSSGFQER
jgi:arsenate reductase (thioredoxin)